MNDQLTAFVIPIPPKIQATPGSVDAAKIAKYELPRGVPRCRLTVWLVDGKLIRDSLDVEFIGGGHYYRYEWIPEGEIWIENDVPTDDVKLFVLHELCERAWMAGEGMGYDDAHARASAVESICRKNPQVLDEYLSRAIVKNIKAERGQK
jgi:hypothetical protein